jgi:hypothetical protein
MMMLMYFKPNYQLELLKPLGLVKISALGLGGGIPYQWLMGLPYSWIIIDLIVVFVISSTMNTSIDAAGHRMMGPIVRRRWQTHNVLTAPLRAAGFSFAAIAVPFWLIGIGFPQEEHLALVVIVVGALVGSSHLWLDAFTPDGVFLTETKHIHLGRVNGNGTVVNWVLSGIGILLVIVAILHWGIFP